MRIAAAIAVAVLCLACPAQLTLAQSLGDVARSERERRNKLPGHAHVLTNEDLQRNRILDAKPPSDAAAPSPAVVIPDRVPLWQVAQQPGFSLGEYARALRQKRHAKPIGDCNLAATAGTDCSAMAGKQRPPTYGKTGLRAELHRPKQQSGGVLPAPSSAGRRSWKQDEARSSATTRGQVPAAVRVRRGDSLWKLAGVHLGSGWLWTLIWKVNPELSNPERIAVGQWLSLPSPELVARARLERRAAFLHKRAQGQAHGTEGLPSATRLHVPGASFAETPVPGTVLTGRHAGKAGRGRGAATAWPTPCCLASPPPKLKL